MNILKSEKAITTLALVVTIIVLLILSGITLNLAIGQNNLLDETKKARNEYAESTENEIIQLNSLDERITDEEETLIEMFKNGTLKVGDYLEYDVPVNVSFTTNDYGTDTSNGFATQTFNTNSNRGINWRILGLGDNEDKLTLDTNEGESLLIISASTVHKDFNELSENSYECDPYLYMGKAEGYVNCCRILDSISNIFINEKYANSARSVTADDINTLLGVEVDYELGKVYRADEAEQNIDTLRTMNGIHTFYENEYSAESFYNSKKTAIENGETDIIGNGYTYSTNDVNNERGDFLFNQETDKSFWLASKYVEAKRKVGYCIGKVNMNSVCLGDGCFYSNGKWYVFGLGVYPVISLKPEVTIDDIQITTYDSDVSDTFNNECYYGTIDNYYSKGNKRSIN